MKSWKGPVFLSAAAAIWGGMYVVSKAVMDHVPPFVLVEMRYLIALLVLGLWAWVKQEYRIDKKDAQSLALVGLVGYTGSIGLQFVGTHLSGAAMGSLITSASPALISLFAWKLLREEMNRTKWMAVVVATLGVLVVVGVPSEGSGSSVAGNAALFGAALTWALYTVLSRKLTLRYSSLTVTFWATLFGIVFTVPLCLWEMSVKPVTIPQDPWVWAGIFYIGVISTAAAFYLWNLGFEYIDASTGSLYFFVQPVVGGLLGAWLLEETLGIPFFAGALLIAVGIGLSTRPSKVPRTKS
ncbi:DMT family transporter [Staphylospora marina]|uniref:DMT family transporter n=1 Tax=Staphylospora marina TaxID=2490858 RepID=UPI000F5BE853|nr:EamA family transporter [Staphylospora marina]